MTSASNRSVGSTHETATIYTYLTMISGEHIGESFPLSDSEENSIGRGPECTFVLNDPLCSRVHTIIFCQEDVWTLRDEDSRNGTFVNEQKTEQAELEEGHIIRIGSTEFSFHQSQQPPTLGPSAPLDLMQTIVKDAPIGANENVFIDASGTPTPEQSRELLLLHQLSVKLLACDDPNEVVQISLDLLKERTNAAVVGFLWVSDEGQLKPKIVIPHDATDQVTLSTSLTDLVTKEGHAVWIANQTASEVDDSVNLRHYADAVCAPLVHNGKTVGAIHVYLDRGRFRQSDFEFTISVANMVALALVRARERSSLETDYKRLVESSPGYDELVGESSQIKNLKSKITKLAPASGCVLIRGESGTGKELVARAIHQASSRADRPMLSVNCAAIAADLMESQLFGHKAGSFTGADRDHVGYFQQADLGTLFLDEVGELTLAGQAKLLRILEGHPFLPVGAVEEVSVDVRVLAATNQNLQEYVNEKKFRADLYYRLSVFELIVPPLRERGGDIGLLVDFFLKSFREQHGRTRLELSDAARERLLGYNWPGNVRQLRNVIDSAVVLADGETIEPNDLGLRDGSTEELDTLEIEHWERKLIAEAMKRTAGNVPEAAKLLGIGRATLYRKLGQDEKEG